MQKLLRLSILLSLLSGPVAWAGDTYTATIDAFRQAGLLKNLGQA